MIQKQQNMVWIIAFVALAALIGIGISCRTIKKPDIKDDSKKFIIAYNSESQGMPVYTLMRVLPEENVEYLGAYDLSVKDIPGGIRETKRKWKPLKTGVVRLYRFQQPRSEPTPTNEEIEANHQPDAYYFIDEVLNVEEITKEQADSLTNTQVNP